MKNQAAKTPLTKDDLTDALKNYPTKDDLKKELSNYPTKEDLNQRLTVSQNAFRTELDYKFQIMRDEIHTEFTQFKDLILNITDPLLKEIETRREDREIGTAQMEEIKTRIHDHEKRITKLEHS